MAQSRHRSRDGFISAPALDRSSHRAGRSLAAASRRRNGSASSGKRARNSKSRVSARTCLLIVLLAGAAVLGFRALRHQTVPSPSGATAPLRTQARSPWVDPQFIAAYQSRLSALLGGQQGTYGISIYDLASGASLGMGQDTVLRAASVNKLELAISLYRRSVSHQIDLDATTLITADDIQNYGTGTIQLAGPGQTYSYRELAQLMLQESDNTASYVIGRRLGLDSVQTEVANWGIVQTSMADNLTTPADVTTLLTRLRRGELLPVAQTAELLDLLQHTAWTDRLQSGVPESLPVAHKIGTDVNVYNDAAIFLDPARPYIVVVLSGGTEEDAALSAMTAISQLAYQFEQSLPAATRK